MATDSDSVSSFEDVTSPETPEMDSEGSLKTSEDQNLEEDVPESISLESFGNLNTSRIQDCIDLESEAAEVGFGVLDTSSTSKTFPTVELVNEEEPEQKVQDLIATEMLELEKSSIPEELKTKVEELKVDETEPLKQEVIALRKKIEDLESQLAFKPILQEITGIWYVDRTHLNRNKVYMKIEAFPDRIKTSYFTRRGISKGSEQVKLTSKSLIGGNGNGKRVDYIDENEWITEEMIKKTKKMTERSIKDDKLTVTVTVDGIFAGGDIYKRAAKIPEVAPLVIRCLRRCCQACNCRDPWDWFTFLLYLLTIIFYGFCLVALHFIAKSYCWLWSLF